MASNSTQNSGHALIQSKKNLRGRGKVIYGDAFSLDFKKELRECVDVIFNDVKTDRRLI